MAPQRWTQLEVKIMAGSEPWVLIRSSRGLFKLPLDASIAEALQGVAAGWKMDRRPHTPGQATVRVPLATFLAEWGRQQP